jgi:hypothetical protein
MSTPEPTISNLSLDPTVLSRVAGLALRKEAVVIEQGQAQPAGASRGSATAGVYRVSGVARDGDVPLDWAVILKIIRPAAAAFNPASREVDHPIYWKRGALVYGSGLLDQLPGGIAAPRCFVVEERPDESCYLWLEDLQDNYDVRWPLAQYGHAARRLGRFNGAYLAGCPLPDYPWLGPPGTMCGLLQAFGFVQDIVRDPATWQHPLLRAAFPTAIADRLLRFWADQPPLLDGLNRLPQTFCHKDAFRRNMFAPPPTDEQGPLTLIDWAYPDLGEIGLDIADLFGASYSTFSVEPTDLPIFDATIFNNYLAGLRDAGWQGDPHLARFGFAASASLKYGSLLLWLGDLATRSAILSGKRSPACPSTPFSITRPLSSPTCSTLRMKLILCWLLSSQLQLYRPSLSNSPKTRFL